jgi:hypothetical protein
MRAPGDALAKIAPCVTCHPRIVDIELQALSERRHECECVSIARVAISDFNQVIGHIVADEPHIIELHDQRRHVGQKRIWDALCRPGKACKTCSTGRITKPLGVLREDCFEWVGVVSHDEKRLKPAMPMIGRLADVAASTKPGPITWVAAAPPRMVMKSDQFSPSASFIHSIKFAIGSTSLL